MIPSSFTRKFLILFAFVVCVFYLAYRVMFTFNDTGPYALTVSIALYVAECFGIFNLFLFFLQVWEVKEPPAQPVLEGRTVDVFVPTYNEDLTILRPTLEACVRMDYPHKTYVLDDGRRPEVEALARELGINYISRPDNRHFKAGNLNNAFERTDGEFVVVLDADHVPEPHFITRLIGYFSDQRLGYVQTPHAFYNFDAFQARLDHRNRRYWEEGHTFYYVIQPGRNHWGCPIFAGSAAMFRRSAIRDVGLMATETITEDMHTGLRMNAKGWKSLAISERLVAGQAAPDITTFHSQRMRWGTGNLSIFKYDNPITARGLTMPQRLCYLGSMLHWASGPFKLIIYLTPIAMLFSGIPPVKFFSWELIGITLIYLIVSLTTMKIVSNGFTSIINSELFSMVNFWTQCKCVVRAIVGYGARQFNVTPKGTAVAAMRKKRGIWPFIRPQTYLIILSVLALFWGWSRPVLGISDDWFKPVVPTIWVLLFFWLAYKVTQRAFWPADRRNITRHTVHVPVEYDTAEGTGNPRYGVTVDLNETGMALVAYERFNPQDILRITIRGASEVIKCKGEIRTVTDLTRGQVADGFRYGIAFQNLTPPQMDAINRICLHYGVPRMYEEFDRQRAGLLGGLQSRLDRGMAQRRSEYRNAYRLPIVINSGTTEDTAQFSATEDLSRSAVAALLDSELPRNTPVGYLIATPLGEVRGTGRVIRTQKSNYGGREYYRTVIEFTDFEGQARTTLHTLVNPDEVGPLRETLKPERKPVMVQMAGATLVAILIAVPLILLQGGIFHYFHRDDRLLRDIAWRAENHQPLPDDTTELDRIFEQTKKEKNPTSDRLVLLMSALKAYDRRPDQLVIAEALAARNTSDLSLQQTLVYAQLNAEKFADAERTFENLKRDAEKSGKFDAERLWQLELSGARVAVARATRGNGEIKEAIDRYQKLYAVDPNHVAANEMPNGVPLRREYGGVLLRAGQSNPDYYDDAKRVLQTAPLDDVESRRLLIAAYLLKARSIETDSRVQQVQKNELQNREYEGAERVADDLLAYSRRKADPGLENLGERMKADIQMARKSWTNAQEIMAKLLEPYGGDINRADPDVVRRLAQIQLGQGNYAGALNAFETLLRNQRVSGDQKTEVIRGFIDAAANSTVTIRQDEREVALEIYRTSLQHIENDPIYLARLGWVLSRAKQVNESKAVLEKAIAKEKGGASAAMRNQLAAILIETENMKEAADVLANSNHFNSKEILAGLYMRNGDVGSLAEAEKVLREMLDTYKLGYTNPDGTQVKAEDIKRAEMMLGSTLTSLAIKRGGAGSDTFTHAIAHYIAMDRKYPNDAEVMAGLGFAYLWSAGRTTNAVDKSEAYSQALKQFTKILTTKSFTPGSGDQLLGTRGKVEDGFIDAAASAPTLDASQTAVAREIAARRMAGPAPTPVAAARLAWVLVKSGDPDARKEAIDLLKKSADANPTKDEDRRELARVFSAAGAPKEAAALMSTLVKTAADRMELVNNYAASRDWAAAKAELEKILKDDAASLEEKRKARKELAKITAWSGDHADALVLIDQLVKEDPDDVEMRIFQANVNLWMKTPESLDRSLEQYTALAKKFPQNMDVLAGFANAAAKSRGPLTAEQQTMLVDLSNKATAPDMKDALFIARVAEALANKFDETMKVKAQQLALKAAGLDPKEPITRREVAYVLANPKIGLFKEADALFVGIELVGEDRKQYVFIASQAENYEAARRQARLYLAEQLPGSVKHREARRLLADVLTWKGDYEEALAIYNQLAEEQKGNKDLRIQIAEVYRYWQNYPQALQKFAELLTEDFENKQLWIGFIDAASSAPKIDHLKELLLRIYNRYANEITDPRALSRMAWVMIRLKEQEKAHRLLTRAVAANPQSPAVRKELAGALAGIERRQEAIEMLTPPNVIATLDVTELLNLADLLSAENMLDRAESELAKVITEVSDRKSRVRYASVLLWNEKYAKAKEVLSRLTRDFPGDREIQLLLAEAYLWSKDYTNALNRFTELVMTGFDPKTSQDPLADPDIWRGFVDAAAGAVGESLREFPRKNVGPMFTPEQRNAIVNRAYDNLSMVRDKTYAFNKAEIDKLVASGAQNDTNFETRKRSLEEKNERRMKTLAGSMGRLGLLIGLVGVTPEERKKSGSCFATGLAIDRYNRDVWLQYAQTLTALGDDVAAKPIFDWLLTNPEKKVPPPTGPKTNGNGNGHENGNGVK
jgi:cellulose synthase/poly-beta-1,6-N-acetylglucosamine synthase-like glycosyltransferase/predicted Zn-dependent protease